MTNLDYCIKRGKSLFSKVPLQPTQAMDARNGNGVIRSEQTGSREENEINVLQCPNRGENGGLQKFLGPVFRVGTMVGSLWEENYPKSPCYFVFPDIKKPR